MSNNIYFSICSSNYLAYARTLFASLRAADPQARFVLFLADEVRDHYDPAALGFEVIEARAIGIDCFADMAFRYDVMEFNTAIKPFCIRYLFDQRGADAAIYLDPDLYVLRPLVHVEAALAEGHDIVLTPHACAPLDDGGDPDDIRILRTGAYNLGFGAFANTPSARALVDWWATHLKGNCVVDLEAGLFVDQKFMDLAPSLVDSARILRHPGYNTAYWNLMHRPVTRGADGWLAAGQDLHFLHFSGVIPGRRDVFSKHQNRYTARNIGELSVLLREYLAQLDANDRLGDVRFSTIPYQYGSYIDGTPIPKEFRLIYRRHRLSGQPTPLLALFTPNLDLYLQPVPGLSRPGEPVINLLMHQVWSDRSDLQLAFDLHSPVDRWRFAEWFITSGRRERSLPERCYEVVESSIRSLRAAEAAAAASASAPGSAAKTPAPPKASLKVRLSKRALDMAPRVRGLWVGLPQPMRLAVKRALVSGADLPLLEHELRPGQVPRRPVPARSRLRDPNLPPGISLFGYLHAESGVGEGARRAARAISVAGVPCAAHVLTTGGVFDEDEAFDAVPVSRGPSPYRVALMHVNADQTAHLPRVIDSGLLHGKYRIGYWAWELAKFPEAWRPALDEVDEIWTPSGFVADAVRAATDKTVRVMPHPVPLPAASAFGRDHFGLPADVPLLLTAFDCNSYVERKNPFAAVRAFRDAFPAGGDGPRLVIKMHGRLNRGGRLDELMAAIEGDRRIQVIDRVLSRDELAGLQQAADAFISLHRSEGFGLNIAECMAAGKVVIATAYGGNTDFCSSANSLLVGSTPVPLSADDYPHAEGQHWAEPDHDQAVAAVRAALAGGALARDLGAAARATMASGYSYEAIGQRVVAASKGL